MTTTEPGRAGRRTGLDALLEPLRVDLKVADGALQRLLTDSKGSAARLAEDLRTAVRQLDADVRVARAELDVALASQREHYLAAIRELADALRARLDALRVRAELGRMELREFGERFTEAEEALAVARRRIDEAEGDVNATVDALRDGLADTLAALTAAVQAAWSALRKAGSAP